MYIRALVNSWVKQAWQHCQEQGQLPKDEIMDLELERPNQPEHGDFATNLALKLAKPARMAPRKIADLLVAQLAPRQELFQKVEIAGPGFINLFLQPGWWLQEADAIRVQAGAYGCATWGKGRKLLLEFVSANPVGPLNVVSARAAAVGDALANILQSQGLEVAREYYINDAGKQAFLLGKSCYVRWRQSLGEELAMPEEGYQGGYVKDLAQAIATEAGPELASKSEEEAINLFWVQGVAKMVASHQEDLKAFGVVFDHWFSERTLHDSRRVEQAVTMLREHDVVYEKDGALWFASTRFGDDKDRVLKKADGYWAYIAADIAYHQDKYGRGYQELLDLWGPDHHGYIPRMKAAMQALGHDPQTFQVHIVQQVNLIEGGQQVAMSKRAGKFITMRELVEDVGKDVTRFFFLMRSTDSHLDFDLDLARSHSDENPVYYIQYAHARICSLLRKAQAEGFTLPAENDKIMATHNPLPEELVLIKALTIYPEILEVCAKTLEPHGLAFALRDLATAFHRFYTVCRVLDDSQRELSSIRLALCDAVKVVLANGLTLLGLDSPEKM